MKAKRGGTYHSYGVTFGLGELILDTVNADGMVGVQILGLLPEHVKKMGEMTTPEARETAVPIFCLSFVDKASLEMLISTLRFICDHYDELKSEIPTPEPPHDEAK